MIAEDLRDIGDLYRTEAAIYRCREEMLSLEYTNGLMIFSNRPEEGIPTDEFFYPIYVGVNSKGNYFFFYDQDEGTKKVLLRKVVFDPLEGETKEFYFPKGNNVF